MTRVIFSGHMIDTEGRPTPRFPPSCVPEALTRITDAVAGVTDPDAEAISGAACGADLLFCDAWLASGRRLVVFLPRSEEAFLDESVRFAGPRWEDAYHRVVEHDNTLVVGPEPGMDDLANPHEANNLRMLERAADDGDLVGVFLWDGGGGDGPGGTGHMVEQVEAAGGRTVIIPPVPGDG